MTLDSTLALHDSFSNTLDQIVNALNYTVSAMEEMRSCVESPINDEGFRSARTAVDRMNDSIRTMEAAAQGSSSEVQGYTEKVRETGETAKQAAGASKQLGDSIKESGEEGQYASGGFMSTADSISQMLMAAGGYKVLGLVKDGLVSAASAAIEFESAITGVYKTVDGTKEQLSELSDNIKKMSTEIPATTTEIAGVAEAAGQLGIKTQDITNFTRTMIDLGEATNLTSDAAASALAKFANITGMDASNYQNLGSVIVQLGNNFATTEADIVNMSSYLASAAHLAGMAETDIMGLSTAMSSVGIEAEAGGSAMSKLITKMQVAVETGDGLRDWADVAGMSISEFADEFENNAVGALQDFITGLNDVERNGASASVILQNMNLDDIRLSNTIRALASSNDLMSNAVNTANTAWEKNTALTNETNKRYSTLESKLQMTKNSAENLKTAIGDALTPALGGLNDIAKKVLDRTAEFAQNHKAITAGVTGFVGSIGAAAGALTTVIPIASQATQAFMSLKNSMAVKIAAQQGISVADAASQAGSKLLGMAGKLGLIVGGASLAVGAIAGLVTAFSSANDKVEDYNGTLEQCRNELEDTTAQYDAVVSVYGQQSDAAKALSDEIDTLNAQYEKGGGVVADYAQRVKDSAESYRKWKEDYQSQQDAVTSSTTTAQIAVAQLQTLSEKSVKTNADLNLMGKYADYLNDTFRCNIEVNYRTGELTGFDPTSASDLIIAQAKANMQNVAVSEYISSDTQEKYIENARKLKGAYSEWQDAEKELADYINYSGFANASIDDAMGAAIYRKVAELTDNRNKLKKAYDEAYTTQTNYKATMQGMAITGGVADTFDSYIDYLDQMAEGTDKADRSFKIFKDDFVGESESMAEIVTRQKQMLEDDAVSGALQNIAQELGKTAEAYDEMYQAAYKSLSSQYGLFDKAKDKITEVLDAFNKDNETDYKGSGGVLHARLDALNSQIKEMEKLDKAVDELSNAKYNNIMMTEQRAQNVIVNSASDIMQHQTDSLSMWDDYKDAMLTKIANGDKEAQAELLAVSAELKKGHTDIVADIVEKWAKLDSDTRNAASGIGEEAVDVQQAMTLTQTVIAASLTTIGLESLQAYNASKGVVDSLSSGIDAGYSMLRQKVTMVEQLMARLASFNVNINVDKKGKVTASDSTEGLASGTFSARSGVTLVGERGPELVVLHGGERVYNALETNRILEGADKNIPQNQYARGTLSAAPGLALVGENGPELVDFGGGEIVYTANETRRIIEHHSSISNVPKSNITVSIPSLEDDLGRQERKYERAEYYTQSLPPENDSPTLSADDFKRLTSLSQRETLSKVYKPNITNKIELNNNISRDADVDEIVHELSAKLIDVMAVTAEGVYS